MSGLNSVKNSQESAHYMPVMSLDMRPEVEAFFHHSTNTISYVVKDPGSQHAVVIDSALDYDPNSARISTEFADKIIKYVHDNQLQVDWVLETHAHADHLSAAQYLKEKLGAPVAIGRSITAVQKTFASLFNLEEGFPVDGSQFDRLLDEGNKLLAGDLQIDILHTPGHTPACVSYFIGDAAFIGDTLFMPDYGSARADFPGGDARKLYKSAQKILALPDETRLFMCHDYMPGGRPPQWQSSVAEEREKNIHLHTGISEQAFVTMRESRDAKLDMPTLIIPSIQFNIRAGALPPAEANGVAYLKIPVNVLR